jgi:transcriptional regulator with XRE-family HTH domain
MGIKPRLKLAHLAEKLLQIRNTLGLSQTEMLRRLGTEDLISYKQISKYELGISEPPLIILLQYAHVAGVHMEALVDDELDLPDKMPASTNHAEIKRVYKSRRRKR